MGRDAVSKAAWTGAVIAAGLTLLAAWLGGALDGLLAGPLAVAALAASCLGGLAGTRRRSSAAPEPLRTSAERHVIAEALLAHVPDPVILVDRRAVVIEANPAARALLPAMRLRHPLSFGLRAPDVLDGIEEVLRTGLTLKVAYATRVPTERAFEVQMGALAMPDGSGPNVVLFLRDLTAARRLEAMRVDFVANASHELRTPLASLLGFIETLQGPARNDAPARERFLDIMRAQAQRMTRLIDDLLSLSRIELREHMPPTKPVDLGALARQMVEMQAPLAAERGVSVTFVGEGAFPVLGEPDELARVVENLVENAVRYGGGRVAVELARVDGRHGPEIVLSVRDDGPGIAPEHIPRLTERFYRVNVASSREKGGTGLGLAIVKHSLNRHQGRLQIESTLDIGTTVRAVLPARPEAGAAGTSADGGRDPPATDS